MPDIIPLQKDKEFGGTSQAPIELRAQVAASGTALTQLGANWKSKREAAVSARLRGRALHAPALAPKHWHHWREGQGPGQPKGWGPPTPACSLRLLAPLQPDITAPCPMPTGASATASTGTRAATAAAVRSRTQKQPPTLESPSAVSPAAPCLPAPTISPAARAGQTPVRDTCPGGPPTPHHVPSWSWRCRPAELRARCRRSGDQSRAVLE